MVLILALLYQAEISHGCSNGNVSLFKAILQWLANCSIKDSKTTVDFLPYL